MQITGGVYNSRKIQTAEYENIKPTLSKTRQGIFNTLASIIEFDNKIFFDMFSGSGIMSLEALSRGFKVISFEKDKKTAQQIKQIFKRLGTEAALYFGDSLKNIKKIQLQADVIFIDPPYDSNLYEQALKIIKNENKLNQSGIIVIEHPVKKIIDFSGFQIIKTKRYANTQISYLII